MKILSQKQVNASVAESRKQQIDDGVKVAQKVDLLRGEVAEMQKAKILFMEQSKKEIEQATTPLYERLENLKSEVLSLELRREELLKPLDEEYDILRLKKEELNRDREEFVIKKSEFNEKEEELEQDELELKSRIRTSLIVERDAKKLQDKAQKDSEDAQTIVKIAIERKEEIEREILDKMSELRTKESQIEFQRQSNETISEQLKTKELALNVRERQINDKYIALQQAQEHVEHN